MVEHQPNHNPHIQHVFTWANRVRQQGIGDSTLRIQQFFIPNPDIDSYFEDIQTTRKLLAALFPDGNTPVDPETVRKKYAKVFLILILTENGPFIEWFVRHGDLCDQYLPFRTRPPNFPSKGCDFFLAFDRQQWEFCARIFQGERNQQFDAKDLVLPIISKEKLGGGGSAVIHKIDLHPAYIMFGRETSSRNGSSHENAHTFVLKTYNTPDAERYYNNEVKGFTSPNVRNATNIVSFYGSFIWEGTYNVLLEYADRGTLKQYFNATQPPSRGRDIIKFYGELFKILPALAAIHGVQPSDSTIFQGWHQDIKPSNILVKSKGRGSPYDVEFKLADLGLSHFKKHVPSQGEATDRDSYGTRAYGAPECYRDDDTERISLQIKQVVDIWSFGCVLSEAAVWVVHGISKLSEYQRQRGKKTARIPGFRDGDCFHDGFKVLTLVTETHKELNEDIRLCDHVTKPTVEMVGKEMLIEAESRTYARALNHRTKGILKEAEDKLRSPTSSAGTCRFSETTNQSPPRTPPEPPPAHSSTTFRNSHSQHLSSHRPVNSLASRPYDEDEAHHPELDGHFGGRSSSPHAHYNSCGPRPRTTGQINHSQYQSSLDHLNRTSHVDLSRDSPASPSWPYPTAVNIRRRRTPPELSLAVDTRNVHDRSSEEGQEIYNVGHANATAAPLGGVPQTNTATLARSPLFSSRTYQHHARTGSRMRLAGIVSAASSSIHHPPDSQAMRRPSFLSVSQARLWKSGVKDHKPTRLPDAHLLADLNKRDHIFLIDNSFSMRKHRQQTQDLFGLLAYMVKDKDPDGIELHFTMINDRKERSKNTSQLARTLETAQYAGESNIRSKLDAILQDYYAKLRHHTSPRCWFLNMIRPQRPVRRQTIYIFTDGVWQPECDPAELIKTLVQTLEQHGMNREQFGIEFIRFGDDPDGISRLNHLDSGLGLPMDIVDTEPFFNGNVWKMLLGAINKWFDGDAVKSNSSLVTSQSLDTSPRTISLHDVGRRFTHT